MKMIEQPVNNKNLLVHLLSAFPELQESYQVEFQEWSRDEPPGNYIIVGTVFTPRFEQDIATGRLTDFLRRSAEFFERVCTSGDDEAVNVIWIRVFERLIFQPTGLKLLWPILGTETKKRIRDAAQRWSEAARYFGHTEGLASENLPPE